jgi:hypothetical protein
MNTDRLLTVELRVEVTVEVTGIAACTTVDDRLLWIKVESVSVLTVTDEVVAEEVMDVLSEVVETGSVVTSVVVPVTETSTEDTGVTVLTDTVWLSTVDVTVWIAAVSVAKIVEKWVLETVISTWEVTVLTIELLGVTLLVSVFRMITVE